MQPCDKGPILDSINIKMDRALDALTVLAVQNEQIKTLRTDVNELFDRMRIVEGAPVKRLEKAAWLMLGGVGSIILIVFTKFVSS